MPGILRITENCNTKDRVRESVTVLAVLVSGSADSFYSSVSNSILDFSILDSKKCKSQWNLQISTKLPYLYLFSLFKKHLHPIWPTAVEMYHFVHFTESGWCPWYVFAFFHPRTWCWATRWASSPSDWPCCGLLSFMSPAGGFSPLALL